MTGEKGPEIRSFRSRRPGCWAFLGALQVGLIMDPRNKSQIDLPWNRAHFAAWCIVSSPLALSMDLTDPLPKSRQTPGGPRALPKRL